jgi:hypothetical protein
VLRLPSRRFIYHVDPLRSLVRDESQGFIRSWVVSAQDSMLHRCLVCCEIAGKLCVI